MVRLAHLRNHSYIYSIHGTRVSTTLRRYSTTISPPPERYDTNDLDQMLGVSLLEDVAVAEESCHGGAIFSYPKREVYAGGSI